MHLFGEKKVDEAKQSPPRKRTEICEKRELRAHARPSIGRYNRLVKIKR